ncbi:TPA: hypothetical protein HA238_04620 [Candidatus Micrarchaeota archaeon]|nr:hypothetical protein [Candidatus Micrarchaeota archaeon]
MGFLDSLMGDSGKSKEVRTEVQQSNAPFNVITSFAPVRLSARKDNMVRMIVKLTNTANEPQLVSVDILLPKKELIGFEPTCINKHMEKRLGEIKAGDSVELVIPIWGSNQTRDGNYPMELTAYSHYINYDKVLNYVKKRITLRVV